MIIEEKVARYLKNSRRWVQECRQLGRSRPPSQKLTEPQSNRISVKLLS